MIPRQKRKAVIPSWIPADQILHLSPAARNRINRDFDSRGIFLNIPYSQRYSNLEIAILSTVTAYDLMPRMARERSKLEMRLLKIVELMLCCAYGLTDLSYAKRMNMPFELGLLLAFGKESFVTSSRHYSALQTVSDLNFADIHYHRGTVGGLVKELSRWIEQTCSAKRIRTETLLRRYRRLQTIRKDLGPDFEKLLPQEIGKLLEVVHDEFRMKPIRGIALGKISIPWSLPRTCYNRCFSTWRPAFLSSSPALSTRCSQKPVWLWLKCWSG